MVIDNPNAGELLKEAAKLYAEKNKEYGGTYKQHGEIMKALFPHGLTIETVGEFNYYHLLVLITVKLVRCTNSFHRGSIHQDSAHDMGIYSFMLEEIGEGLSDENNHNRGK